MKNRNFEPETAAPEAVEAVYILKDGEPVCLSVPDDGGDDDA